MGRGPAAEALDVLLDDIARDQGDGQDGGPVADPVVPVGTLPRFVGAQPQPAGDRFRHSAPSPEQIARLGSEAGGSHLVSHGRFHLFLGNLIGIAEPMD
mgnify:CR=1 FL=1